MTPRPAAALALAATLLLALAPAPGHAESLHLCDRPADQSAGEKDVLLRFGAVVREQLSASGQDVALIARSGLDLHRLDVRYSHAGIALREAADVPWTVRELYYACDERRPRIYDEGVSGFVLGTDDPRTSWISLVFLPRDPAASLRRAALDRRTALRTLGATYSANAYAFSTRYQNCNQWVAELLATAWGDPVEAADPLDAREQAQRWLYGQRYAPTTFDLGTRALLAVAWVVPWLHNDDHPRAFLDAARYEVSMPASIETFVHRTIPAATRVELCHAGARIVVHHGWDDLPDGCQPGPDDEVVDLAAS